VLQASGPGVFLKMIFGTKWTLACRCGVPRSGTGTAGRCDWRVRAGVPGAKGNAGEEGYLPLVVVDGKGEKESGRPCIYALFKHVDGYSRDDDAMAVVIAVQYSVCDAACRHAL
jgi:hypothetical protein